MPARQIRKNPKQKSRSSRSRKQFTKMINQKGGDTGRYVLPPAYFGKGIQGYYADGSSELNSCGKQNAVSQGVISANGKWAGPNLYPMMGGSCGCSGRRNLKPNTMQTQKGGNPLKKKSLKPNTMQTQKGGNPLKKNKSKSNKSKSSKKH